MHSIYTHPAAARTVSIMNIDSSRQLFRHYSLKRIKVPDERGSWVPLGPDRYGQPASIVAGYGNNITRVKTIIYARTKQSSTMLKFMSPRLEQAVSFTHA